MKNKILKYSIILALFISASTFTSCETTDLDINDNPNELTVDSADPNFILNSIQFSFALQNMNLSGISNGVMRHTNLFSTYASVAPASTMDGAWAQTYSITNNLNLLQELAASSNLNKQVGIGKILEAWAYVNLVDYIGTAVYSEAVNPAFPQPNLDSGESIYDAMYLQIDEALLDLKGSSDSDPIDLFFNGDISKWVKVANTLKLKMYIQSKLAAPAIAVTAVNNIISSGNYIKDSSDDFFIQFGTSATNPDNRHPWFQAAYVSGAGGTYMSNDFIFKLKDAKGFEDPRLKYYLYRQTTADPVNTSANTILPCEGNADYDYCYLGDGYWGRDHGDDEGIPNDNNQRTTYGIYPAGGAFDDGTTNSATATSTNLGGAGIYPIWLSSFSKFMLAESSLAAPVGLGTNGTTLTYLTEAVQDSFDKVQTFSGKPMMASDISDYITYISNEFNATADDQAKLAIIMNEYYIAMWGNSIEAYNNYITYISNEFNATADDQAKLAIIMNEYYIAMWGNSIEAYNNYRRTGFPTLQGSVISGTDFPRSYFIPASELNTNDNPNLVQKLLTDRVFWDTNALGFIN